MRKLFFTICFSVLLSVTYNSFAAVRSIVSPREFDQHKQEKLEQKENEDIYEKEKSPEITFDTYEEFLEDRLSKTIISEIPKEEIGITESFDSQLSEEHMEQLAGQSKSYLQKVYEAAIDRTKLNTPENQQNSFEKNEDIYEDSYEYYNTYQEENLEEPDYKSVNVTLPSGKQILAPAIEHSPFMSINIELLADGSAKIKEEIVIVANGDKLKNGLKKSIPKATISREGKSSKIEVNLVAVKIDDKEIEYKIEDMGNMLVLTPKKEFTLESGVYTYEFEYLISRQLWEYDEFNEFYWDVTGNSWNFAISRLGALISLPGSNKELGTSAFIIKDGNPIFDAVNLVSVSGNNIGYIVNRPMFAGESMQFVVSLDKSHFIEDNFSKNVYWYINDYGDVILSLLGLIAIAGAYFISWMFINESKTKSNMSITKTPAVLRYIITNTFDKVSFTSFILDLYRKNIVDIQKTNDVISLIRISDKSSGLRAKEKKAINQLFPNQASSIKIEKQNILKIKRAFDTIKNDTINIVKQFLIKANVGYIFFSLSMLLLVQLGTALLKYSYGKTFIFLIAADIIFFLAILGFRNFSENKIIRHSIKAISIILALATAFVLTAILNLASILFTFAILYIIVTYTEKLSNKNGLIKNLLREVTNSRKYLKENATTIASTRSYITQQANIFALDLEEEFESLVEGKDYNKIDIAKEIVKAI